MLSAPIAVTFAALAVRHPVAGRVAAYAREGFGEAAGAVTGGWFLLAVLIGAPAVSIMGGYYVSDLTGSGTPVAVAVGLAMFGVVLAANVLGLHVSSGLQLVLSTVLVVVVAAAVAAALPSHAAHHWRPFAPHGWWAVGTAASYLVWLFVGWEAVAQLAGEFRRPASDLPRAIALAFGVVTVLYIGLAVASIGVTSGTGSRVPLADLISVGFGRTGRDATAVLAVALTTGTMNVYLGGAGKLAASLASEGVLPRWLGADRHRSVPRRPLLIFAVGEIAVVAALLGGVGSPAVLVRMTSACFVAIYLLALGSALRILDRRRRRIAAAALALMLAVAAFSAVYLLVPLAGAVAALGLRRLARPRLPEAAAGPVSS